jgi:CheY-like chemotaxis protein
VLGNTQILLREAGTDPDTRTKLLAVERCGQHLLTLINQILDLAKVESGKPETRVQPTDLRRLLEDTLLIVTQGADAKGLELVFDIESGLPAQIATDRLKLKQILLNLLDNAIKFTNAGQITLRARPVGSDRVEFSVNDTGRGIPASETDKIFEAFHQSSDGLHVEGTGLGLTINRRLVSLIGGSELRIASTVDAGSRFWFDIPIRLDEPGGAGRGAEPGATARAIDAHARQAVSVMLLDGDAGDTPTIAGWLRQQGCSVDTCSKLPVAISRLQRRHYDVVLVGLRLPGPQAYQWGTAIRQASVNPHLRLVGSSRDVTEQAAMLLHDAGFDAFVQKPSTEQELLTAVLGEARQSGAARPRDATRRFLRLGDWPERDRVAAANILLDAVGVGDIDRLLQCAEGLRHLSAVPAQDALLLQRLVAAFDFDGIRHFAEELRNGGAATALER